MAAFAPHPEDNDLLGANYTANSTTATITISDFSDLTSVEAAPTTGDSRKIIYALLNGIYGNYKLLTDLPTKMTIARTTTVSDTTQTASVTFTVRFTTTDPVTEVAPEAP